jgi:hypothetical protein
MGKNDSKVGRMIKDKELKALKLFFDGYELYNSKIIGQNFTLLNDSDIKVKTIRKYQSYWGGFCYEVDIEIKLSNTMQNDWGYQRWLSNNKRYFNKRVRNRVHRTIYLGFEEIGLVKNINMQIDKVIVL